MRTNAECILCLVTRDLESVPEAVEESERTAYLRDVLRLIAQSDPELCTAQLGARVDDLFQSRFGERKRQNYAELKNIYNARMLSLEDRLQTVIDQSGDSLATAIKLARAGNYIDFGGRHEVDDGLLDRLIADVRNEALNEAEYARFRADMEKAENVVYVADNAGEIVLDKLLIRLLMKRYPNAAITLLTRGAPTLNDATVEDARDVGLTDMMAVRGNGSALPGTVWAEISEEARTLLTGADVIVSKGQANIETLSGCGLNVYYLLLCKCDYFVRRFQVPKLTGMFVNERRMG